MSTALTQEQASVAGLEQRLAEAADKLMEVTLLEQAEHDRADGSPASLEALTAAADAVRAATRERDNVAAALQRRREHLVNAEREAIVDATLVTRRQAREALLKTARRLTPEVAKPLARGMSEILKAGTALAAIRGELVTIAAATGMTPDELMRFRERACDFTLLLTGTWGLVHQAQREGRLPAGQWPTLITRTAPTLWVEHHSPATPEAFAEAAIAQIEDHLDRLFAPTESAAPVDPLS